jgi:hypothetical protein
VARVKADGSATNEPVFQFDSQTQRLIPAPIALGPETDRVYPVPARTCRPMLGFKRFDTAAVTISGIELAEKIKKNQFKIGKLPGRPATAPAIWAAVLAA